MTPKFGGGDDKHDYGRGFYLTENIELAKEWAVCRPNEKNGWVHKYELECDGLKILDFQEKNVLAWLAELMKHRDAADSKRYRMLASKFIDKYGIDTETYDVIKGCERMRPTFTSRKSLCVTISMLIFWKNCYPSAVSESSTVSRQNGHMPDCMN